MLIDDHGNQVAWTDITVLNNDIVKKSQELSATGSSIIQIVFICAILLVLASASFIRVKRDKNI